MSIAVHQRLPVAKQFFREQSEESEIKAEIVSKYFWAWASVITSVQKRTRGRSAESLQYVDLFCGPGRYEDGAQSTPVKIIEQVLTNPEYCDRLVAIFNDKDVSNTQSLQASFDALPAIANLKTPPRIYTGEVDSEVARLFESRNQAPTFAFIDPFGYKGLTLRLVNSILRNWGCDCVFFFNFNRINLGITNDSVECHMDALFGPRRANVMRNYIAARDLTPPQRESFVVEEMCKALREMGGEFVLPFRFKNAKGTRTTHHLIFVSKNFLGYDIMKEIMAKSSSVTESGVATFEYNPADARQPMLNNLWLPLEELRGLLLRDFAGSTLGFEAIYERHSVGKPYLRPSYRAVLCELERDGRVSMDPPLSKRRKNTLGVKVRISFPKIAE